MLPMSSVSDTNKMLFLSCEEFKSHYVAKTINWDEPVVFELEGLKELLQKPDIMSTFSSFSTSLSQHPASKLDGKGQRSLSQREEAVWDHLLNQAMPYELLDLTQSLQGTGLPNYFVQLHKTTWLFGILPTYGSVCTEPQNAGQLRLFTSGELLVSHIGVAAASALIEKGAGLRQIVTAVENISTVEQARSVRGLKLQEIKPGTVLWTPPGGLVGMKPRSAAGHVVGIRRACIRKSTASKSDLLATLTATNTQLQSRPPTADVLQSVQQTQVFLEKCVSAMG